MYILSVAIPVLAIYNCTGWSTRDMEVSNCYINFDFCKILANFFLNWLFFSAFLLGIPIIVYFGIFIGITEFIIYFLRTIQEDIKNIDSTEKDNKS